MTGEKWEVTPYHAWSGLAWIAGALVLILAVALGEDRLAWVALFMSAGIATYNICSAMKMSMQTQREAFELGREHEARQRAEEDVRRI